MRTGGEGDAPRLAVRLLRPSVCRDLLRTTEDHSLKYMDGDILGALVSTTNVARNLFPLQNAVRLCIGRLPLTELSAQSAPHSQWHGATTLQTCGLDKQSPMCKLTMVDCNSCSPLPREGLS